MSLAEVMARSYAAQPPEPLIDAHELAKLLGLRDDLSAVNALAKRLGWPRIVITKDIVRYEASAVLAAIKAAGCDNQPHPRKERKR